MELFLFGIILLIITIWLFFVCTILSIPVILILIFLLTSSIFCIKTSKLK